MHATLDSSRKRTANDEDVIPKSKRAKGSVSDKPLTANTKIEPMKLTLNRMDVTDAGQLSKSPDSETTKGVKMVGMIP